MTLEESGELKAEAETLVPKCEQMSTAASLTTLKPLTVDHNKLWKIFKEMGRPEHLTCFLKNLYAGQETTVRTGHGTTDWFKTGKGVRQGCILSPCLFNLQSTSCEMPGWMSYKLDLRLPGEMSITSDMWMAPPLWQKMKTN